MEETASQRLNRKMANLDNKDAPYSDRFLRVDEVCVLLQVSEPTAYRFMSKLNKELKKKGKEIIAGRISIRYLKERVYL